MRKRGCRPEAGSPLTWKCVEALRNGARLKALRNGVMPNCEDGTDFPFWRKGLRLWRLMATVGDLTVLLGEAAAACPGACGRMGGGVLGVDCIFFALITQ